MSYTYEILSVDTDKRCMEVSYKAEGLPSVIVGTTLPFEGELLEEFIRRFAPISFWEEKTKKTVAPLVGVKGLVEILDTDKLADEARREHTTTYTSVDLNEIIGSSNDS